MIPNLDFSLQLFADICNLFAGVCMCWLNEKIACHNRRYAATNNCNLVYYRTLVGTTSIRIVSTTPQYDPWFQQRASWKEVSCCTMTTVITAYNYPHCEIKPLYGYVHTWLNISVTYTDYLITRQWFLDADYCIVHAWQLQLLASPKSHALLNSVDTDFTTQGQQYRLKHHSLRPKTETIT